MSKQVLLLALLMPTSANSQMVTHVIPQVAAQQLTIAHPSLVIGDVPQATLLLEQLAQLINLIVPSPILLQLVPTITQRHAEQLLHKLPVQHHANWMALLPVLTNALVKMQPIVPLPLVALTPPPPTHVPQIPLAPLLLIQLYVLLMPHKIAQ